MSTFSKHIKSVDSKVGKKAPEDQFYKLWVEANQKGSQLGIFGGVAPQTKSIESYSRVMSESSFSAESSINKKDIQKNSELS